MPSMRSVLLSLAGLNLPVGLEHGEVCRYQRATGLPRRASFRERIRWPWRGSPRRNSTVDAPGLEVHHHCPEHGVRLRPEHAEGIEAPAGDHGIASGGAECAEEGHVGFVEASPVRDCQAR